MKLNNLHIENFRGFKNYDIAFSNKTIVLIGKNGTGKTSLITAIKKGLSFMFAKSSNYKKSLSESNNCIVRSFSLWDSRFDEVERTFSFPIKNEFNATINNKKINWTSYKKKDPGSLHPTLYKDALNTILSDYNKQIDYTLPLVAFFSDSYPHVISNVGGKAAKIAKMDILPRDFGYYGWDEDTNCAELWQRRYIKISNYPKDLKDDIEKIEEQIDFLNILIRNKDEYDKHKVPEWENKIELFTERLEKLKSDKLADKFTKEKQFIDGKILSFTHPLREDLNFINSEFQIDRISVNRPDKKNFSLEFSFNDGRTMHFEILPAGYRRLLSIVFDIAYRSYVLNEDRKTAGIVIIDEIELHLHPTLQQEILQRLRNTFPEIQFIVSTHSPLVISNLKSDNTDNKIIKLENDGTHYFSNNIENIYGIDYTTGLVDIMEAKYRPSTIDNLVDSYVILKIRNKEIEAEKIWNEIFSIVGTNNERIKKEIEDKVEANK